MKRALIVLGLCVVIAAGSKGRAAEPRRGALNGSQKLVVLPFESSDKKARGLPEATRTAVIEFFKDEQVFAGVLTPEEAKDADQAGLLELHATLVDFEPGNMATRVIIGLGTGRAHAGFQFTIKEAGSGAVLWEKTIKEKASFWSNSASSVAQRLELPEKIAKKLLNEVSKAKAK